MSGNVKVVPIGQPSAEQVRLVEQLNRNKDNPVVKDSGKKIDGVSVVGLPPQSPRRKPDDKMEVDEPDDEISRLKRQLKVGNGGIL